MITKHDFPEMENYFYTYKGFDYFLLHNYIQLKFGILYGKIFSTVMYYLLIILRLRMYNNLLLYILHKIYRPRMYKFCILNITSQYFTNKETILLFYPLFHQWFIILTNIIHLNQRLFLNLIFVQINTLCVHAVDNT